MAEQGKHPLQNPENHRKANRSLARSHKSTWLQKRLGWALRRIGLKPVEGFSIKTERDKCGHQKYLFPDFAFPKAKLVVEADGLAWHTEDGDKQRDAKLKRAGWGVLHFKETDINADLNGCALSVKRLLANHDGEYHFVAVKLGRVRRWKLRRTKQVFNLTVEEDESYLAHGWVVHNCRCALLPVVDEGKGFGKVYDEEELADDLGVEL